METPRSRKRLAHLTEFESGGHLWRVTFNPAAKAITFRRKHTRKKVSISLTQVFDQAAGQLELPIK